MTAQDIRAIKKILVTQFDGLDVLSQFLLIRTIWRYGDSLVDARLDQLQTEFGMSRANIINARNTLLGARGGAAGASGYIVEQYVPGRAAAGIGRIKGRPRRGFQLSPDFRRWLTEEGPERVPDLSLHDTIIRHLLFESTGQAGAVPSRVKGKAPDRTGAGERVELANGLLLGLLWILADEHGVVRNIGVTSIARMAGMTRDQVNSQLKKLKRLNYVRARIGGVSGSSLFGKKEGAIYLDPLHPDLRGAHESRNRQWIIMPSNEGVVGAINSAFRTADIIQREALRQAHHREQRKGAASAEQGGVGTSEKGWQHRAQQLRERIGTFESQAVHVAMQVTYDASNSNIRSSVSSCGPLNLYEAFTNAKLSEKKYAQLVVCQFATELLHSNAQQVLGWMEVDGEILSDLQNEVCPKGKEEDQTWSMALAGWFYYLSHALAAEVLRWRAHKLGVEPDELAEMGRFLLIPIVGQEAIGILADEPRSLGDKGGSPVIEASFVSKSDS